ncbi:MAG: tRNA (adenosine(37)-N6)-threonylcarbamoyltransferase complex ATPase subunit type 1 TsaE [Chloroflexi bacterium]|nr:tRNA (adenosine(37)-N6)-threonylcarbamoyltransferase complex ATPase subunit type 1 TsaE [Chloroflexota bacterium]
MSDSELVIVSRSVGETRAFGAALGKLLAAGDVICLQGDLGSGKTSLTQGIGQGMHIDEVINSPTFVFIREHRPSIGNLYLYHVDLYRIDTPEEIGSLGLLDYMYGDGVTVIEWAERARESMPANCLWITIELLEDTQRRLNLRAHGAYYIELLQALRQSLNAEIVAEESQREG